MTNSTAGIRLVRVLGVLERERLATRIELGPLSADETAGLVYHALAVQTRRSSLAAERHLRTAESGSVPSPARAGSLLSLTNPSAESEVFDLRFGRSHI